MAANSYPTQEKAVLAAMADPASRDTVINSYDTPQHGWNPDQKTITHIVVQVGQGRWVVLKDATGGTWTEDGVL